MLWALALGLVSMRIMEPDARWSGDLIARALDSMFLGMAELDAENES